MTQRQIRLSICYFGVVFIWIALAETQLSVRVRNSGGEEMDEVIDANTTQDIVVLKFTQFDGTAVEQTIDFRHEVHIIKLTILDEPALGLTGYQTLCFVARFTRNDFISSDAMSKLRQKNPGTVRHPEEDRGEEEIVMDVELVGSQAQYISPHIKNKCSSARTFMRESDLSLLAKSLGKDYSVLMSSAHLSPAVPLPTCSEVMHPKGSCTCHRVVCMYWYPCGLKYCRGKDSVGKIVSYRCGIKTCSKCWHFVFYSKDKLGCLWDEDLSPED